MAMLKAPAGVALTTALLTIYTNAANSGVREQVRVRIANVDGVNDANVSACNWIDASNGNAALAILPVNAKVAKQDALSFTKILDPGDSIQASASAAGDLVAVPEVLYSETV